MLNSRSVSIRLKLGGHSFSQQNISPAVRDAEQVVVIVETPRVMLVPHSEMVEDRLTEMMQLVGKSPRLTERPVAICTGGEIDAVVAIDRDAYQALCDLLGGRVVFTTPLLNMDHCEERCAVVELGERVCYLRLYDGGLQRADAVEVATNDDVLLYVNGVASDSRLPIYLKGSKECASLLRKYYKSVVCE